MASALSAVRHRPSRAPRERLGHFPCPAGPAKSSTRRTPACRRTTRRTSASRTASRFNAQFRASNAAPISRLRPIADVVAKCPLPDTVPGRRPTNLGQEQFAVELLLGRAVVRPNEVTIPLASLPHRGARGALASGCAPRRLGRLLERAGLVENANRAHRIGREFGDRSAQGLLHAIREALVVPQAGFKKLLQAAGIGVPAYLASGSGRLAGQVGQQPAGMMRKCCTVPGVVKPLEGPQKAVNSGPAAWNRGDGNGFPRQS